MSFVVFQTLARLAASVATSHSHCWFVAGHLNMRKDVIINIWGHGAEIARVISDKIEGIAQKQDRASGMTNMDASPAQHRSRRSADRLAPTERLFDALSLLLAHRVARVQGGAAIDRGTPPVQALCDWRVALSARRSRHERERIVAFVGAEREAPRARRTIIAFSGLALREPLASVRSAATTSRCGSPSARASMSIFFSFRHHFGLDRSGRFAHAATSISRQNSLIAAVLEWFQLHFRCRQPLVEIATANKRPPFVQEYFDRSPVRDPSED